LYKHSKEDSSVSQINEEENLFSDKDGLNHELDSIKTEIADIQKSSELFKSKISSLESNLTSTTEKYDQ